MTRGLQCLTGDAAGGGRRVTPSSTGHRSLGTPSTSPTGLQQPHTLQTSRGSGGLLCRDPTAPESLSHTTGGAVPEGGECLHQ